MDSQPAIRRSLSTVAECCICLDILSDIRPVCMFFHAGRRACRHFVHHECGTGLATSARCKCPLCRVDFEEVRVLPPLADSGTWFDVLADGTDALSREDLLEALEAVIPLSHSELAGILDATGYDWSAPMDKPAFEDLLAPWLTVSVAPRRRPSVQEAAAAADGGTPSTARPSRDRWTSNGHPSSSQTIPSTARPSPYSASPPPAPAAMGIPVPPDHPPMPQWWVGRPFGGNDKVIHDNGAFYLDGGDHYIGRGRWVRDRFCCGWGDDATWIGRFSSVAVHSCLISRAFGLITDAEVLRAECGNLEPVGMPSLWRDRPFGGNAKIVREAGRLYLDGGDFYAGRGRWVGDRFCCPWGDATWVGEFSERGVRSCLVARPYRSMSDGQVRLAACRAQEGWPR
mmetsp:Transcript_42555/g.118506  ORF Transcript_42555/g.118506 Transcript_42555/m.118506 type:complete len:399 (-) Transcript_42555:180-1376(-)